MSLLPEYIIDHHVHLFPDRMFDAVWKKFVSDYGWEVTYQLYYPECVKFLRERKVEYILFSNYAHRKGIARGLNEWNLRVLEEDPGLFCYGAFHPDDDDALEYTRAFLEHPRAIGIKLQLLVQRFFPHNSRLFPLYELLMDRNKRLLFHAGTGPVGNEFVGYAHFRKLMKRYPGLPATVAHMGALEYREFIDLLDECPRLMLDTAFAFLPGNPLCYDLGPEPLERHRHRIVYGSDFPNLIFDRDLEINHLLSMELSPDLYRRVFRENGIAMLEQCRGIDPSRKES